MNFNELQFDLSNGMIALLPYWALYGIVAIGAHCTNCRSVILRWCGGNSREAAILIHQHNANRNKGSEFACGNISYYCQKKLFSVIFKYLPLYACLHHRCWSLILFIRSEENATFRKINNKIPLFPST